MNPNGSQDALYKPRKKLKIVIIGILLALIILVGVVIMMFKSSSFSAAAFPTDISNVRHAELARGDLTKGQKFEIKMDEYMFEAGSSVTVWIDAVNEDTNPTEIGTFKVSDRGVLSASPVIPYAIHAGYHSLMIIGKSYSGEPLEFEDTVLIIGTNPDDIDENKISDKKQPCGPFLNSSGQDADRDGVDDACDPQIIDNRSID